ncbi:MAG TPA: PAS domain S-box protein, partial [Allocoleopsis sp.]
MWFEIHAYPCKVGFSIYFRDITGRKQDQARRQQAESALYESESRFRLIVESVKDYAIFTLDLDGYITSWNPGAERLLGYPEAEIIGQPSYTIFTPEDRATRQAEKEHQTALAEGKAEDERWHLRQDGSRFFASGLLMQLRDEAGQLQGLVKILRDITASHQTREREQFLSESSEILAGTLDYKTTLFNIARLAVPFLADFCFFDILNAYGQIERVAWHHNDPTKQGWFEQLQRYTPPQEHENHPITNVLTTGNANLVTHVSEAWIQACAINDDHLQFIRESQVRSLITVPLIAHGRTLGALTVCLTEASHRHYTQTDLAVVEELGRRAALALDNARLYQQAQESNRLKDEFMAVLSHELRSPLNPILGWIQMIRKGNLTTTQIEKAWQTIERNAKLQAQLVEDLLDISRILRGKLSFNSGVVNLATTI